MLHLHLTFVEKEPNSLNERLIRKSGTLIYDWFPLDSLMSCLHSLLGYSTGEFQALQLIVLAAFGAVDLPIAPYMLVHFLEI